MVVVIKNEAQNQTHSTVPRSCDLDLALKSCDFLNLRHTLQYHAYRISKGKSRIQKRTSDSCSGTSKTVEYVKFEKIPTTFSLCPSYMDASVNSQDIVS